MVRIMIDSLDQNPALGSREQKDLVFWTDFPKERYPSAPEPFITNQGPVGETGRRRGLKIRPRVNSSVARHFQTVFIVMKIKAFVKMALLNKLSKASKRWAPQPTVGTTDHRSM
jgi:hypothetical protein